MRRLDRVSHEEGVELGRGQVGGGHGLGRGGVSGGEGGVEADGVTRERGRVVAEVDVGYCRREASALRKIRVCRPSAARQGQPGELAAPDRRPR